jgi:hypothetical protein
MLFNFSLSLAAKPHFCSCFKEVVFNSTQALGKSGSFLLSNFFQK